MINISNENSRMLQDINSNMRTICAGWSLMNDLDELDANMIGIVKQLAAEICDAFDTFSIEKEKVSVDTISLQLIKIGQLKSFAYVCLNYVFVSCENTNLHYQLNFLTRQVDEAVHVLECTML